MLSVAVAFMSAAVDSSVANTQERARARAKVAAQNAASMAITELWGSFEGAGGDTNELWSLRAHLDGLGLVDTAAEIEVLGVYVLDAERGFDQVRERRGDAEAARPIVPENDDRAGPLAAGEHDVEIPVVVKIGEIDALGAWLVKR